MAAPLPGAAAAGAKHDNTGTPASAPVGASGRNGPSVAMPASIGASASMQDYGQRALAAINGGTPQQAGDVARLISVCGVNPTTRFAVETLKENGRFDNAMANRVLAQVDEQDRQCQSLTDEMKAKKKELAERALLGGVKGIGAVYAESVQFDPAESMRRPLIAALHADLLDGDPSPALTLALNGRRWGLSAVEVRAYEIAFDTLSADGIREIVTRQSGEATVSLTEDEARQAAALAAPWIAAAKKARADQEAAREAGGRRPPGG
ncbi:hypothetical protein [Mitsuaria sp. GD03876]|uniref:hypothetical protein n=1 Tax=Mitsuaria sp. GD03876 TaxID=2975399 RepID=UPI00244D4851|nr:hypothetical protein [Mitsuaria sp. GD03876]MDH0864438.1 hypothetical protein [Mitsuaria sp. GD03876]